MHFVSNLVKMTLHRVHLKYYKALQSITIPLLDPLCCMTSPQYTFQPLKSTVAPQNTWWVLLLDGANTDHMQRPSIVGSSAYSLTFWSGVDILDFWPLVKSWYIIIFYSLDPYIHWSTGDSVKINIIWSLTRYYSYRYSILRRVCVSISKHFLTWVNCVHYSHDFIIGSITFLLRVCVNLLQCNLYSILRRLCVRLSRHFLTLTHCDHCSRCFITGSITRLLWVCINLVECYQGVCQHI